MTALISHGEVEIQTGNHLPHRISNEPYTAELYASRVHVIEIALSSHDNKPRRVPRVTNNLEKVK